MSKMYYGTTNIVIFFKKHPKMIYKYEIVILKDKYGAECGGGVVGEKVK